VPVNQELAKKVLEQIDRDELAQLGCDLVNIPSPTGEERAIAEYILDWYGRNGIKPVARETEAGRPNAVGIVKGQGNGLSLMFNGHMDTSFTGTDADFRMAAGLEPESELKATITPEGKIRGLGISNMKGGVAAFMMAGKALKNSSVPLKGDVILAAVVGEISRTPIDEFQGREYRGEGAGTRHILTHGIQSDYAVVADGSDLNIVWTQTGVVDVKITTYGQAEAAWGTKRATHPPAELNAIMKMMRIVEAIDGWADRFEEDYIYESPSGPVFPKVNIGAIQGGAPYRPNYFPGVCSIYVDVRTPPNVRAVTVQHEIEQALAPLGVQYDLELYKSLLGHEGKGVEPIVESLEAINQHLFGKKLDVESPARASIWTDTNVYNELGIPAVKIGPRGKRFGRIEELPIDDMVKAAQIYALVALDMCSRERPAAR
jgi:acetylornithine deacetylase/succinyl-diaminopimelate desuccinylase-like protein